MALTLVNLTGFTRGVSSDETGINISEFKRTIEPEFKEILNAKDNTARGFAVAPAKLLVTITGEVNTSTGIMAAVFSTAFAPSNSTTFFGAPTTGLYLDKAEVTDKRDGWRDLSADFSAYAGIP